MGGVPPENKWVPQAEKTPKNEHIVQMVCFEQCENLKIHEHFEEIERL